MTKVFLAATLFFANTAWANSLGCDFSSPNVSERTQIPVKTGMWTFEKTSGDFQFTMDLDGSLIIGIKIKDTVKNITSQTIATTGAGIFAKPRQLSLESDGRYAEVNCW